MYVLYENEDWVIKLTTEIPLWNLRVSTLAGNFAMVDQELNVNDFVVFAWQLKQKYTSCRIWRDKGWQCRKIRIVKAFWQSTSHIILAKTKFQLQHFQWFITNPLGLHVPHVCGKFSQPEQRHRYAFTFWIWFLLTWILAHCITVYPHTSSKNCCKITALLSYFTSFRGDNIGSSCINSEATFVPHFFTQLQPPFDKILHCFNSKDTKRHAPKTRLHAFLLCTPILYSSRVFMQCHRSFQVDYFPSHIPK